MALIPYLLYDELLRPVAGSWNRPLIRHGHHRPDTQCYVLASHYDKDGFKVNLDVQQFRPNEITVKLVDDFVVVEGKHEEREDEHGYISRHFQRRYKLREDINADAITSSLSSDGILTITAPKKQPVPLPGINERIVPITRVPGPALKQNTDKQADQ